MTSLALPCALHADDRLEIEDSSMVTDDLKPLLLLGVMNYVGGQCDHECYVQIDYAGARLLRDRLDQFLQGEKQ